MLSLPLIPPPDDQSTWLRTSFRPRADSPPPPPTATTGAQAPGQHAQHHRQQRQQRDEEKRQQQARSPLALLAADEAAIAQRKAAIRNFGAHWIRPPGVPKTLQAMLEEEAERREQEELERQERGLLDMQAQQQLEETRQRAAEVAAEGGEDAGEGTGERDLDDDIPEADAEATFNEDSMMDGSSQMEQERYEELEEAELTGAARDEEELGVEHERDLDESIPDAGGYQHTDTEAEDMTSESGLQDSMAMESARGSPSIAGVAPAPSPQYQWRQGHDSTRDMEALSHVQRFQHAPSSALPRSPGSVNLSSPQVESSFVESSPVMQRANRGGRGGGVGRSRFFRSQRHSDG